MQKIMSMILSLTIMLGFVTPVHATEISVTDGENQQTIKLEDIINAGDIQLREVEEKSLDLDTEEEISDSTTSEVIDDSKDTDKPSDETENNNEESSDDNVVLDIPSYSVDEEMEKYLEDYLNSLNKNENNDLTDEVLDEVLNGEENIDIIDDEKL